MNAAQRIEERARQKLEDPATAQTVLDTPFMAEGASESPPRARRRWHTEEGDDGEARDVVDSRRKPARFYAPAGQCAFCDRRREAAKRTMRAVRERGEA